MMTSNNMESGLPWFAYSGNDRDIVISSRARLARNLANFPFPFKFQRDDKERVQALIFDAFSKIEDNKKFYAISTESLSPLSAQILEERGVKKSSAKKRALGLVGESGIVMSADGKSSCTVNDIDHIHIAHFSSGLNLRYTYNECHKIDRALQKHLQFAANCDFGYLCSAIRNTGSGMKLSVRIHVPAITHSGKLKDLFDYLHTNEVSVMPAFPELSHTSAAGNFFQIENTSALIGNEIDQVANIEAVCKYIVESERKAIENFSDNKSTIIRNSVLRAYSISKFSLLVSLREAIDIISDIKLGVQLHIIQGIDIDSLCALLYSIQNGHLLYLLETGTFYFEKDIEKNQNIKLDRLRAVVLQEKFDKITLTE